MSFHLEASALAKGYDQVPVFHDVGLALEAGTLAAIVGPSGCGKSTLLHLLGLIDRPDRGQIRLGTTDFTRLDEDGAARVRATRIGFVFQFDHLLPELTLAENVAVPLRLAGVGRSEALARARSGLVAVGLDALGERLPAELSGGERQRGAIARALVHDPELLLADEPTGNLDPDNAQAVLTLFRSLVKRPGRVAIVVTHDPAVAMGCDRTMRLEGGTLRDVS